MTQSVKAEPLYYDGSSTESEPYDDVETPALATPAATPRVSTSPKRETPAAKPERFAADERVNVLDLAPALPPLPAPASETHFPAAPEVEGTVEEPPESPETRETCRKCGRTALREVAELTPRLAGQEARGGCSCCGLTLPQWCFTTLQRAHAMPKCRGCRGVATIADTLTARAYKLLDKRLRARTIAAAASTAPTASTATTSAACAAPAAAAPAQEATMLRCELCALPLASVTETKARRKTKLKCSCCAREVPEAFFSNAQRLKQELRRCKGCLGHVGSPKPSIMAVVAGLKAWEARYPDRRKKSKKSKDKASERGDDTLALLRNRVARHKFALAALARKRAENDLRGSTRIEYMKELAKEEAALRHQGKLLRQQNPAVYREVMGAKVKRPRFGKDEDDEQSGKDEDESGEDGEDDGHGRMEADAAPVWKRRRTEGAAAQVTDNAE